MIEFIDIFFNQWDFKKLINELNLLFESKVDWR